MNIPCIKIRLKNLFVDCSRAMRRFLHSLKPKTDLLFSKSPEKKSLPSLPVFLDTDLESISATANISNCVPATRLQLLTKIQPKDKTTELYNITISTLLKENEIQKAYAQIQEMEDQGISPNLETFEILITDLFARKRIKVGRNLLSILREHKIKPSPLIKACLVACYEIAIAREQILALPDDPKINRILVLGQLMTPSFQLVNEMLLSKRKFDTLTLQLILQKALEQNQEWTVVKLWGLLREYDLNSGLLTRLTDFFARQSSFELLLEVLRKYRQMHKLEAYHFDTLYQVSCQRKKFRIVADLMEVLDFDLKPLMKELESDESYNIVMKLYQESSNVQLGRALILSSQLVQAKELYSTNPKGFHNQMLQLYLTNEQYAEALELGANDSQGFSLLCKHFMESMRPELLQHCLSFVGNLEQEEAYRLHFYLKNLNTLLLPENVTELLSEIEKELEIKL